MLTPSQRRDAARCLAEVVDLIDSGRLEATSDERAHLAGSLAVLTAEEPFLE